MARYLARLAAVAALACSIGTSGGTALADEFVTFGGGSTGGTFFVVTAGMARLVDKYVDGVQATNRVTAATTENTRLLGREKIQFALTAASGPYAAAKGLPPFEGEMYDNVRYVATGYSSAFQIVVLEDSDVQSIADLAGKRVGVLVGITAEDWFPRLAELYDISGTYDAYNLRAGELMTSLRDGNIDVAVYSGSAPTPAITDVATGRSVRFIPIDQAQGEEMISTTHPFFSIGTIPAGTYPGLDQDITSLLNPILLVTHAGVSDDLVYQVTKLLLEDHHDELSAIHANAGEFNVEHAGQSMVVAPHPGAVRFYEEKGIALE